jgi:hypothetical protein
VSCPWIKCGYPLSSNKISVSPAGRAPAPAGIYVLHIRRAYEKSSCLVSKHSSKHVRKLCWSSAAYTVKHFHKGQATNVPLMNSKMCLSTNSSSFQPNTSFTAVLQNRTLALEESMRTTVSASSPTRRSAQRFLFVNSKVSFCCFCELALVDMEVSYKVVLLVK